MEGFDFNTLVSEDDRLFVDNEGQLTGNITRAVFAASSADSVGGRVALDARSVPSVTV